MSVESDQTVPAFFLGIIFAAIVVGIWYAGAISERGDTRDSCRSFGRVQLWDEEFKCTSQGKEVKP